MRDRKGVDPDGKGGGDLGGVEGAIFSKRKKHRKFEIERQFYKKKGTNFKTTETTNTKVWMRRD